MSSSSISDSVHGSPIHFGDSAYDEKIVVSVTQTSGWLVPWTVYYTAEGKYSGAVDLSDVSVTYTEVAGIRCTWFH